jgi:hypothetical protein
MKEIIFMTASFLYAVRHFYVRAYLRTCTVKILGWGRDHPPPDFLDAERLLTPVLLFPCSE